MTRMREWFARAKRSDGPERQTVELVLKSALAATVAWFVANNLIAADSPAFAPFSAVVIMQVTVYQSLLQSLRYVAAVCVGVALQGGLGLAFRPGVVTFALVALAALVISQWRRLGAQRTQVATAAFFAFSMYVSGSGTAERLTQLGQIVLLVLIGCGIGVVVNVVVLPPLRYRGAEHGVRALASALRSLIDDIGQAVRDGDLDEEHTAEWRSRAARLRPINDQARASLETARESLYLNPRLLLARRGRRTSFTGYEELLEALQRITYQVGSLTRCLDQNATEIADGGGFLREYAGLLGHLSRVAGVLAELDEDRLSGQAGELCAATEEAERARARLADAGAHDDVPLDDPTRPYGLLLIEATRLTEEFRHTSEALSAEVSPRSAR